MKNNFYFYFSIGSLFFTLLLVYSIYEMKYKFGDIIDVKTILTVVGTVFGAYFGAKVAGKYAINSVEKQIESNNTKENEKRVKTIKIIMTEIFIFRRYMELVLDNKDSMHVTLRGLYDLVDDLIKSRAIKLENTLNQVDWMYIPAEEFMMMTITKELVNNILIDIESINNRTKLEDQGETFIILWEKTESWKEIVEKLTDIENRLKQYT